MTFNRSYSNIFKRQIKVDFRIKDIIRRGVQVIFDAGILMYFKKQPTFCVIHFSAKRGYRLKIEFLLVFPTTRSWVFALLFDLRIDSINSKIVSSQEFKKRFQQ
jgi:hypothetical protein